MRAESTRAESVDDPPNEELKKELIIISPSRPDRARRDAAADFPMMPSELSGERGRQWTINAMNVLRADFQRSADTHLVAQALPAFPNVRFLWKDESSHPSGSLKHRLARSLFLHAIVSGWISEGTLVVEASSGSTAVSEAFFAQQLGLRYIAVMPEGTSPQKISLIERYGGEAHFVSCASECVSECERMVRERKNCHFLNQFVFAERATDFRSNNNIAESIFTQMALEPFPLPSYIVCGAGTGGTSATLGRYVRYKGYFSKVIVADPEASVFTEHYLSGDGSLVGKAGRIEGIGRPRVEPSFLRHVVDGMVCVPDAFTVGALLCIERSTGRRVGGSSGTIFCAVLTLAEAMRARGESGSIVGILCDGGERYKNTLYSSQWRIDHGISQCKVEEAEELIANFSGLKSCKIPSISSTPSTPLRPGSSSAALKDGWEWPLFVVTKNDFEEDSREADSKR
jgi:cysteine synthase